MHIKTSDYNYRLVDVFVFQVTDSNFSLLSETEDTSAGFESYLRV